jgi:methionyl-tRNA formyltransferase
MPKIPAQVKKCLVVAKHDFYLNDALAALSNQEVETFIAKSTSEMNSVLESNPNIDVIFFPHFSEIIPEEIFNRFLCIGFHTGKLPRGRGGSPIQHQILEGDYLCPVSAIQIVGTLDAGPIYLQREADLSTGNIVEILAQLSLVVASMISEIVLGIPIPIKQQGESQVRKRIQERDSKLVIEDLTDREIYDRIRMVDGLDYPPAYIEIGNIRLILTSAEWEEGRLKFISRIERI